MEMKNYHRMFAEKLALAGSGNSDLEEFSDNVKACIEEIAKRLAAKSGAEPESVEEALEQVVLEHIENAMQDVFGLQCNVEEVDAQLENDEVDHE